MSKLVPLNGARTHPLTAHAHIVLADIANAPMARLAVNPGCANRLLRGGLVEEVYLPNPYKKHNGQNCAFLAITDAGRAELGSRK